MQACVFHRLSLLPLACNDTTVAGLGIQPTNTTFQSSDVLKVCSQITSIPSTSLRKRRRRSTLSVGSATIKIVSPDDLTAPAAQKACQLVAEHGCPAGDESITASSYIIGNPSHRFSTSAKLCIVAVSDVQQGATP